MRCDLLKSAAIVLTTIAVASCADPGDAQDLGPRTAPGTVIVGSANGTASRIEALIYANALRTAGTAVQTRLGLGPGDAAIDAVERGDITIAPALTGLLWERYRPGAAQPSAAGDADDAKVQWDSQYVALSAVLPEGLGLGDPTPALDQPMLFVRDGGSGASLRGCEGLTGVVAVPADSPTDLATRYGCTFERTVSVADEAAAARAVTDGQAALAQLGTLSPAAQGLSQVADPDSVVPARAVVPLMRRDGVTVAQTKRLSSVAGELTTVDLAAMVAKVEKDGQTVERVTADWSAEHPLT